MPTSASPELSDRPRRRTFTAQDKLRILVETDQAAETGGIGAILRREGLYSSALTDWRRQRDTGAFTALVPGKRGPKTAEPNPLSAEVTALQRDNARLALRLSRAEAIIDIQKKLRRCWASRWLPATAKLDRGCRGTRTRQRHDRCGLRRARGLTCQRAAAPLPPGRIASDRPTTTKADPGTERSATAGGAGSVACDALRRPGAEIYASLLDEGVYHCSVRTMYRILGQHGEVRERREQLRHPVYRKPELLAERPNQVWSWDITKLMGPTKWSYFYLYVILDIFSRRVVGWCVADAESAVLFRPLFDDAIAKHNVPPGQLTLHADRGGPMKAKATALLLADLGVTRSHNRPHTSNDNPFSESHFKTLKYQPRFPQRFGCIIEDAKSFCRSFFDWYNRDHHHAGIGLMTPDQVHYGQTDAVHAARQDTLEPAFRENPERFVNKAPTPPDKPTAAWINPPAPMPKIQA